MEEIPQGSDPARVLDQAITQAADQGQVFLIAGFFVQTFRTGMQHWRQGDLVPEMTTAVTFLLYGSSKHDTGMSVFSIDVDAIDDLCAALQAAKAGPFVSHEGQRQISIERNNQQQPGDE